MLSRSKGECTYPKNEDRDVVVYVHLWRAATRAHFYYVRIYYDTLIFVLIEPALFLLCLA